MDPRAGRNLFQETRVAADVGRPRVHDTADAFGGGDVELFAEQRGVFIGSGSILPSRHPRPLERQVLVKERRRSAERIRRDVFQNGANDGAARTALRGGG